MVISAKLLLKGPFPPRNPIGNLYLSETRALLGRHARNTIEFSLSLKIRVDPPDVDAERWEIQTVSYAYLLLYGGREIASYHWNFEATGAGAVLTPHAHFGKELPNLAMSPEDRAILGTLASAHMPTGTVPFTALLRTVIRDFGVEPKPLQRESMEDARVRTDQILSEAETLLLSSFDWWSRKARTM